MEAIVDVQGFKRPVNKFVLKELAVLRFDDDQLSTALFQPPFDWFCLPAKYQYTNSWLQRNYHGLSWYSGDLSYAMIRDVLVSLLCGVSRIYVKGAEKIAWLRDHYDSTIVDLEKLGCPSLQKLRSASASRCLHHTTCVKFFCAAENAELLRAWCRKNLPSMERSFRMFFDTDNLAAMDTKDIAQLPKEFLGIFASRSIEDAWDRLPADFKEDKIIRDCRRCRKHDRSTGEDDYDGPRKMIKNCAQCQFSLKM